MGDTQRDVKGDAEDIVKREASKTEAFRLAYRGICPYCAGTGHRSTARSAKGSELERHEKHGTPCGKCGGTGKAKIFGMAIWVLLIIPYALVAL